MSSPSRLRRSLTTVSSERAHLATHPPIVDTAATAPSTDAAHSAESGFSTSIFISAIRCLLTYIVFPFVAPLVGLSDSVGPGLGLAIGVLAITANVFSIRRFFKAQHRWRYKVTVLHVCVIGLLLVLMFHDIQDLIN